MIKGRIGHYRPTIQQQIHFNRGWYPCPGFIGDPDQQRRKFERWHSRPYAAWMLYWKARPEKYKRMLEYNRRKTK